MTSERARLTRESVIYQVYPRSFQDSDGDGIGDLDGITSRLEHIRDLGCDGVWLSPVFRSPQADMGYDVSDYCDIAPEYGDIAAADRLVARAHELGLGVLFDIVPCHTSIEHRWFREHPDWYVIRDTEERPNNWKSHFGGSAWDRDPHGRGWYLHTFYPEQPNLNWRNPEVVEAMHGAMRFWLDRGVDGFRVDAIACLYVDEQLRDNPPARSFQGPRDHPDWASLEPVHQIEQPEVFDAVAGLRRAFPDAYLVAETGLRSDLARYTEHFDTAFCMQLVLSDRDPARIAALIDEAARVPGIAWVVANHDVPRLASRWGSELARAIAVLQLALPGSAFVYQGDEIGMLDGPGGDPPYDRAGGDRFRHPMQWTRDGGFSEAEPWLPLVDPAARNVADQHADRDSMLGLYRRLLALRHEMRGPLRNLDADGDLITFQRDTHRVAVNLGGTPRDAGALGEVLLATHDLGESHVIPAHTAVVARR